ncbi:MAG TPA: hypothetical protein VKM72_36185 [Thermoanaerobaculia bacterium]|nr:hypothetical protein [Thermoanaerobaculia bacterium]
MTRGQAVAYKVLSAFSFVAGFLLLRFSYLAIFRNVNYSENKNLQGLMYSKMAAMPASILGIVAIVVACVILIKGLGKVME